MYEICELIRYGDDERQLHRKEAEIDDYDAIEHISEQEMIEEC